MYGNLNIGKEKHRMPLICEVCGNEDAAEDSPVSAHLYICTNCREDRRPPDLSGLREEGQ